MTPEVGDGTRSFFEVIFETVWVQVGLLDR